MTYRTKAASALYASHAEVFEFMAAFAKFEYALKQAAFTRVGARGQVEADWAAFQSSVHSVVDSLLPSEDPRAKSARALMNEPPGVQALQPDKTPKWESAGTWGKTDTDRLCSALKRVRNNLFHGGKELRGTLARDLDLVRWGLDVLDMLIESHDQVKTHFEEE